MKYIKTFEQLNYNFNFGDCNIYAMAMHRLYNYPLYAVKGYFKEDDYDGLDNNSYDEEIAHIVVKIGNDKYLDVDGEFSSDKLMELCNTSYFEYMKIVPISEKEAKGMCLGLDEYELMNDNYLETDIQNVINYIKFKSAE